LYLQADNLLTWQSHKGIDPEQALSGNTNSRSYNQRIVSFGVNLEFKKKIDKMKNIFKILFAFMALVMLAGCSEEFLDEPKPTDQVSESVVLLQEVV
jgi:hypothetical protein